MALLDLSYSSQALLRSVKVKILIPDGVLGGKVVEPPYRTLYFLPGYSAAAEDLVTFLGLRAQAELKGIAIVIPDGENLFYQDLPDRMLFYSTYIGKELVEMTRKLLPLSYKKEDTFIGGISMGGYGAMYNGLKYNDTFSKIIALSPAADPYMLMNDNDGTGFSMKQFQGLFGSKEEYEASDSCLAAAFGKWNQETGPSLFMCCGTGDRTVYASVKALEETLRKLQIPHIYDEEPGDHEFYYWEAVLDRAFSFLAGITPKTRDKLLCPDVLAAALED